MSRPVGTRKSGYIGKPVCYSRRVVKKGHAKKGEITERWLREHDPRYEKGEIPETVVVCIAGEE